VRIDIRRDNLISNGHGFALVKPGRTPLHTLIVLDSARRHSKYARTDRQRRCALRLRVTASAAMRMVWGLLALMLMTPFLSSCQSIRKSKESMDAPSTLPELSEEAQARAEALAHFSQGLINEDNQDIAGALSHYRQAVALDPHNEELNLRLAIVLLQQKRREEAIGLIERFVENNPKAEKSILLLALIYNAANDFPKAEAMYRRILKFSQDKTEAYIELAIILVKQDREKEAIKLLQRAATNMEDPTELLKTLGSIHLQLAKKLEGAASNKQRKAAIQVFERARKIQPDDIGILYQLGNLYIRNGEFAKAIDRFTTIEKGNTENLQLKRRLALAFLKGGEHEAVEEKLLTLAEQSKSPEYIYYYLGELYLEESPETAIKYFRKSIQNTTHGAAPFLKLAVLTVDEDPEGAVDLLIQALKKNPTSAALAEMLGYTYFVLDQPGEAMQYFEQAKIVAEAADPEIINPTFYFNYAITAQKAGRTGKAAKLLNTAMTRNLAYLDAYLQFAFRQEDTNLQAKAREVLEKLGEIQPDEPNVYLYLGLLNSYFKAYPAAIQAFEKAESLVQDMDPIQREEILNPTFYFWYGAACEREGQCEKAENLFLKCLDMDHQNAEAYNYLAYMWAEKGIKLERARDFINKALEIDPSSGAYIDTLGWIYYMQGDYKQALIEIKKAAEIMPDDPTIIEHLGDVLFKLSDTDQALSYWGQSFKLDPENGKLGEKLQEHGIDLDTLREEAEQDKIPEDKTLPKNNKQEDIHPALTPLPDANEPEQETPLQNNESHE